MATEEQTQYNNVNFILPTRQRIGQRLTISDRTVAKLSFVLERLGSISGDVSFAIRKVSDDSVVGTGVWGDARDIPTSPTWEEVTLDGAVYVNEEVRIAVEWPTATYNASNNLRFHFQTSDVKASELYTHYQGGAWDDTAAWDAAYKYTYGAPRVTTQAVTDITTTTATGNGNILDLGGDSVTQHGHCWSTSANPTTADNKTEEGAAGATGSFTSSMTGLTPETLYYVRAYATNAIGTSYGNQVTFTTLTAFTPWAIVI